jgi:hypothetical protein
VENGELQTITETCDVTLVRALELVHLRKFDVYWSVHRCDSQRNEEPTRCYLGLFITLMICSTCFVHIYAHHQEFTNIYHCSPHGMSASWVLMVVRCGFGWLCGWAGSIKTQEADGPCGEQWFIIVSKFCG